MYGPTQRKEEYLRTALQGIKVNAKGITTVEIPTGKNNTAEATSMTNALSNFWKGFTNWITHPTGWKLEHKPMDFKAQEVETLLNFENKEITQAGSNKQSQLGQTTRGAQGLHQGMQSESNISIKVQAVYICKILQKVIDDFYLYNWGPDAIPAELKVEGIDNKADLEEAQKDQVLMAMFPAWVQDPIITAFMRKKYGYPGGDEIEESGAGPDGTKKDADGNPMPAQPGNTQPTDKTSEINQEAKEHGPMIKQIESDAKANKTKPVQEYAKQIVKAHENKTLKEGDVCDCGRAHIAPTRLSDFTRKPTRYEDKVQLSEIATNINNFSQKYTEEIQNSFKNYIIPKYKKDLQSALSRAVTDTQKYNAVIDTTLSNKDKVKSIIKNLLTEQISRGYVGAKKELTKKKLSTPELPAGAYGWCAANAEILTDTLYNDSIKKLRLSAVTGIDNAKTVEQIIFDAAEDFDDYVNDRTKIGAQYISVKALNEGRFNAFQEAKDEIQGFQFSALLENSCPLCEELDGKTFKIDDPDSTEYQPPLHPNCNCILVPILMDEDAPEKWDGLDESVSDKNEKYKKLSESVVLGGVGSGVYDHGGSNEKKTEKMKALYKKGQEHKGRSISELIDSGEIPESVADPRDGEDREKRAFYEAGKNGEQMPVYGIGYRYGQAPESEYSYNGQSQRMENGTSMMHAIDDNGNILNSKDALSAHFIKESNGNPLPIYKYSGLIVNGKGGDGEPLMVGLNKGELVSKSGLIKAIGKENYI
jgi:SPP1 gp7 family putative phage head morphogenesis protein